ncbi:hypothetical protein ACLOJK_002543 [Asimina triloba]
MSIFVGLITLASFCILIYLWRNLQESNLRSIKDSDAGPGLDLDPVLVTSGNMKMNRKVGIAMIEYALIDAATNSFSHENILGEGGFGHVYKAHFSNNFVAAVKRLDSGREDLVKEFDVWFVKLSFNAKLSDFGLAVTGDQNKCNIKLSGTVGYVAPEYLIDGKLTEKSDVYAFGVVLLELLMGKKPVEELAPSQCQSIVSWVAAVAILCVQPEPSYRPLITDVLHSLIPLVPSELGGTLRVAKDAGN